MESTSRYSGKMTKNGDQKVSVSVAAGAFTDNTVSAIAAAFKSRRYLSMRSGAKKADQEGRLSRRPCQNLRE
jgi:hypothetical protein